MDAIVGQSPWVHSIRRRIAQVSKYASNVLITGPSGTGKEVIAKAIHRNGPRAVKPFVPVDCAAITGTLFASQLFGHEKGAFTGANFATLGAFRAADGGTIFLDEIGELEPELQAKLLRVIQSREVVPVGSHAGIPVDLRIVAATNRDLADEVRRGRFRLDLYYRLNVVSIETLPLKDRLEDIELLGNHFLAKIAKDTGVPLMRLSPEALDKLRSYDWPGNVRELLNVLERAAIFAEGEVIVPEGITLQPSGIDRPLPRPIATPDLGPSGTANRLQAALLDVEEAARNAESSQDGWPTLADVERTFIRVTLEHTHHNQSAAARLLRVDRRQLARKIKRYGLFIPRRG
jgi:DNA-binding NtrC family response regulator